MANVEVKVMGRGWWAQAQGDSDSYNLNKRKKPDRPSREANGTRRTQQGWHASFDISGTIEMPSPDGKDKTVRFAGSHEGQEIVFVGKLMREDKDAKLRTTGLRVRWTHIESKNNNNILHLRGNNFLTTRLYSLPDKITAVAERVEIKCENKANLKLYRRGGGSRTLSQALGRAGLVFFTLGFAYNFYKLYQTYGRNFTDHIDVKPFALNAALGAIAPTGGLVSGALADTLADDSSSFLQNLTNPVSLLFNGLSFTSFAPALPLIGSLLTLA